MKLDYLDEFMVLAQYGEVNRAAKVLGISQPTLSKHIIQLELSLGVQLFTRSVHGLTLNRYGEVFMPFAEKILLEQKLYTAQLQRQKQHSRVGVSIGFIYSVVMYGYLDLFNKFANENPNIPLSLQESISWELSAALDAKEFDFVFYNEHGSEKNSEIYGRVPILTDTMAAAVPPSHPLTSKETVTLSDLANEPFIMWPKNSMCYNILMPAFHSQGLEPNIITYSPDSRHIQNFIHDGYGVSVLPKRRTILEKNPQVVLIDLQPELSLKLNMIYLKNDLSPQASVFLKFICDELGIQKECAK